MGRKLDPRTDIFSGGSVLYELLTRVPPFLAPNEMELLVLVRETRYTPVRERNPMIPPALEAIVDTAMSRKPSDRYQTADDFANALHNFLVVHAPDLTRSHLGRFVRQLFADDIEKELRALEEYVVESADNEQVGVNLIADALGPDADFSKFSPVPAGEEGEAIQRPRDGTVEAGDGGGASVLDPALSSEPTVILESSDLIQRLESTDPERVQPESEVLWKKGDDIGEMPSRAETREDRNPPEQTLPLAQRPVEPAAQPQEQPQEHQSPKLSLDGSLHTAHTVILDLEEQREALEQPATESPARQRPVASDTKEMPAVAAPEAGVDPNAEEAPEALSAKSNDDTPLEPVSFHELPTGQIEEDGSVAPRLTDADTAELEVSDLVAVVDAEKRAQPSGASALQPVIHTETTQLLEVDDLDPEGQGVDDEQGDPGQA